MYCWKLDRDNANVKMARDDNVNESNPGNTLKIDDGSLRNALMRLVSCHWILPRYFLEGDTNKIDIRVNIRLHKNNEILF